MALACKQRLALIWKSANLQVSCGISPPFGGLSPTSGQVTHVLLTRLPRYRGLPPFAFDLHVLGTPPAFVLSQDQTLQLYSVELNWRQPGFRLRKAWLAVHSVLRARALARSS